MQTTLDFVGDLKIEVSVTWQDADEGVEPGPVIDWDVYDHNGNRLHIEHWAYEALDAAIADDPRVLVLTYQVRDAAAMGPAQRRLYAEVG